MYLKWDFYARQVSARLVLDKVLALNEGGSSGGWGFQLGNYMLRSLGLISPTSGVVDFPADAQGLPSSVSMVFQSFALFPWLTVLQNVEVGLQARNVPAPERRTRALAAIDLVGLDGFESAYPKELSGGMRQRVGLARSSVGSPQIILADGQPFLGALDFSLTAETLRTYRPADPLELRVGCLQVRF